VDAFAVNSMPEDNPGTKMPASRPAMPESSMQDIIASISRIIAEDSRIPGPAPGSSRDNSGVLELTEAIEDDGSVRKLNSGEPLVRPAAAEAPASTTAASTETTPAADLAPPPSQPDDGRNNLVSAVTAEAAVGAFARLGSAAGEQPPTPVLALGAGGRTLEEIVRDVLRPLLQAWLDNHLPGIVERLVHDEIQRLVREARPR
jgi:uncharacterized protein